MKRLPNRIFSIYVMASFGITVMGSLSGCASMNSRFDCPMTPGVMCKSLDEVNTMVNEGKLGGLSYDEVGDSPRTDASLNKAKVIDRRLDCQAYSTANVFKSKGKENKENRYVERIWLAPYVDDAGNYYSGHTVYHSVQQPGADHFHQLDDNTKRCS